jgi:two-component system NarL family sensor kinase
MEPAGDTGMHQRAAASSRGRSRRARELRILYAVAEALNSATDVRQALERTLTLVAGLLGLRTGWVWLLDPATGQFYSAAVRNLPPYLQEPVRMAGSWCECIGAFRDGELRPTNIDVIECSRLLPAVRANDTALTQGLRYHASIPLYFQEKPLGIMNLTGPSWRKLTRDELRLLATIAAQVGVAIERARLAEERARLARAEERARIAREIHDTLAQGLTAIGLHVEGALRALERDPSRARERLERALAMARESLEEARRSVLDLRASPPAAQPLPEALAALARAFTTETGVRVHVRTSTTGARTLEGEDGTASGDPRQLPLRVEAELYRIVQEALANVRKHAHAREVQITLRLTPRTLRLTVRDDGRGFEPGARPEATGSTGHGLQGMRERARLLGGSLRLASRPGRGTAIVAIIPLLPAQEAGAP